MTNHPISPLRRHNSASAYTPPTITVALDTIPVRPYGSDTWINVPLADIRIVRLADDGLCDVIYTARRRLNSDLTGDENRSGETTIDHLLIALGWQPGMGHNEHLAHLTRSDVP